MNLKSLAERLATDYLRLVQRQIETFKLIHDGRQNTVFLITDETGTPSIARYRSTREFWYEDYIKEPLLTDILDVDIPYVIAHDDTQRPQLLISEYVDGNLLADTKVDANIAIKVAETLQHIHVPAHDATNFNDFISRKTSNITWKDDFVSTLIATAADCGFAHKDTLTLLQRCDTSITNAQTRLVLIHNDFHFKNLIQRANGKICVLDWDSASIGPAEKDFVKLLDWSHENTGAVTHILDVYQTNTGRELDGELIELFRIFSGLRQISFQRKAFEHGVAQEAISQGGFFASNNKVIEALNDTVAGLGLAPWEPALEK